MPAPDAHFLNLPTHWSVLKRAAADENAQTVRQNAWNQLLEYYLPAVRAYLMGCTRDADRTDELVQKFSLQFLGGGFRNADQEKGPFRHYLKRSLSNLVRQEGARRERFEPLPDSTDGPAGESPEDARFLAEYVNAMLDRAWSSLRAEQEATGTPYFDLLKLAMEREELSSDELAVLATAVRGEPFTAVRVRKILSRARHKFASHLYEQVVNGLDDPAPEAVAEELAELKLLPYCGAILKLRASAVPTPSAD